MTAGQPTEHKQRGAATRLTGLPIFLFFALVFSVVLTDPALSEAAQLNAVDWRPTEAGIVVEIRTEGSGYSCNSFTLDDPPRIVVDAPGLESPFAQEQLVAVDTPPVRRVRYSRHPGKVRFVIETEKAALARYSVTPAAAGGFSVLIASGSGATAKKPGREPATDEIGTEIKRLTETLRSQKLAIDTLMEQNRALEARLAELEATREQSAKKPAEADVQKQKELEQRVKELEDAEVAREDATREIIRDALSTLGSKINESVALGGTLEVTGGWTEDFYGASGGMLELSTVELDLEIQPSEWVLGSLVLEYDQGTDVVFPTTSGFDTGVDRINLDTAYVVVGDPQRFPPYLTVGRIILPFGISTGNPVADVLTIEDPLTIEAFEMRQTAIGVGFGFPTPAVAPATPPVTPPPVRPLVLNPLISSISSALGYEPSGLPPPAPTPLTPRATPPMFNVGLYSFNGETSEGSSQTDYNPKDHLNATVGFRNQGNCGRPFDQLQGSAFCPWSLDVSVDYNSSIFDSRFLSHEYKSFLGQIGYVPGMAASVKTTLGPVALVGEWNGAISRATFVDDLGNRVRIRPSAWQVALGYQFDWNPWVEAIGAQGTYLTVGYSESYDLGGVTQVVDGAPDRVGFLPRRRLILGAGEWVLENLRFAVEYAYNLDYRKDEGGTYHSAHGILSQITLVW
jgi:hypothetical protein